MRLICVVNNLKICHYQSLVFQHENSSPYFSTQSSNTIGQAC